MRYFLSILFILSVAVMHAQDVSVTLNCPRVVRVNEPFQIDVQVNANCTKPVLPEMSAFSVVREIGQTQSSRQVSIVNGKVTQSVLIAYSFLIQATQEGTQEIGSVEVTVDKKAYQSAPVTVQVVAGNQQPAQQQSGTEAASSDNAQVQTNNRDVFLEVLPDRTKIYQGEYLTATLKLFSKLNVSSINNVTFPVFEGFFKQDIETPPLHNLDREMVNGEMHLTGVLRKFVLFPQKSGTLTIAPASITVGIPQQRTRDFFEDFFGGPRAVPRELTSNPVNITVMPLPEGKPDSFTGGVGQMKFETSIDKTTVAANDPVTLKISISGSGNMKFVDAPRFNLPPDFEVYDPKISNNLNPSATSGSKTFEYLIIPRHGGNYKIPVIEFSYFDPQAKQYKTLRSAEFNITVEKGAEQPGSTVISGVTREDVKFLGKDIRYLKTDRKKLRYVGDNFFGSWKFWLWYMIPLLAFGVFVYLRREHIRKYANTAMIKNKKANRYAVKRLKRARGLMDKGQKEQFYEELSRALWGYLSDKLTIPVAGLSKDNAKSVLEQHGVDPALVDGFIAVVDDCEFARYAPSAAGSDMNALYNRAVDMIDKMQKAIQ